MGYSAVHNNNNLVCSIDTETTGLECGKHEIIQLCILPLTADYKISKEFRPFEIKIKPEKIDEINADDIEKVSRRLLQQALTGGLERWTAVDLLGRWFEELKLPPGKKIVPLGCNYLFDRDFIREFLGGPVSYEYYFRSDYRDVQQAALLINDMADWHSDRIPFPKVKLSYLCSQLKIEHNNKHDALGDCIATAEVYRRLMRFNDYMIQTTPKPEAEEAKSDPA